MGGSYTRQGCMETHTPVTNHSLRLSGRDCLLINVGLSWIVWNHDFWVNKHVLINARPDRRWLPQLQRGVFNQQLMDGIIALHSQVINVKAGGRLRVSASFEFAACALAVRVAVTSHKHGHTTIDVTNIDRSAKRLLRRLENMRKRANRAEIRRSGRDAYAHEARSWNEFVRWLRVAFLDCRCKRKRRLKPMRHRRAIIGQLTQWTREELIDRGEPLPPEPELRRLVRLFLRYVRRGRMRCDVRDLMGDKAFAAMRVASFVQTRVEKAAGILRKTS